MRNRASLRQSKKVRNPVDFDFFRSTLIQEAGNLLREDYDWSKEVAAVKAPALLIFGDADSVQPSHAVEFFQLLGGGKRDGGWDGSGISNARLAILPGLTHYNVFSSPALVAAATSFLNVNIAK